MLDTRVNDVLSRIQDMLSRADQIAWGWESRSAERDQMGEVEYLVEGAFIETLLLLETAGLSETFKAVRELNEKAKADYDKCGVTDAGLYLEWGSKLRHYLSALRDTLGEPQVQTVTKDLIDILRNTQYAITDRDCFDSPPRDEREVHTRIEAVLRCVFPDLLTKPPVQKPIKNFQPDTGLPSTQTLIEYEYVASQADAKRAADEILADTRAYSSPEWNKFIYVVYETSRIKPERQWKDLLRKSGVGADTQIIVVHGERPPRPLRAKAKRSKLAPGEVTEGVVSTTRDTQ